MKKKKKSSPFREACVFLAPHVIKSQNRKHLG
jgi:hypothetical protein